ncbi:glycosyl transferase family 1 [Colwellia sp. MT41]|uniref:Glycosyl transferase family 1 n=1 Tax=Colwellia marinimaniae TaxID=1513592 RepID=A0ABQ0MXC9_9GAMM|nr:MULTISPECIES: glycosyltransferase family 4 protein [Colwellia]ALO35768.1 glycosyl transferase family 1 [Colwellia sp. MT41]GAW96907.1 glycosyl transferase family 1 [Colwellia marinimaniae]
MTTVVNQEVSNSEIELIIGNSKRNFSGITSTMLQVVAYQKDMMPLRIMGRNNLTDTSLAISFWQVVKMCQRPLANGKFRIFHARRVDEMIQGVVLKYLFRAKIKLVFSSAAQRKRASFTCWLTRRMDAVIAMCKASASYLEKPPSAVIYHGVNTSAYVASKDKQQAWQTLNLLAPNQTKGKRGIAILGRVRKQKGVHLFVQSCIAILKDHPDYTAVIVGGIAAKHETYAQELRDSIAKAGLSERIVFVGEQDFADIPKIFSSLSLVVALSESEGFGLTILEAMSSGAAVLASEAGAWPEVIRQGIDGYVVPVNDLVAVTDKMALLLSDETKLAQMGRSGRQRVEQHYSVEREAKELTRFLKALV